MNAMEKDFYSLQVEKELRQLGMPTYLGDETREKLLGKDVITLQFEMKYDQMGVKKTAMIDLYLEKYAHMGFHVPAGYKMTMKDQPGKAHLFPTGSELKINAREAFNLLQGRAVSKVLWNPETNRFRNSWLKLNSRDNDSNHENPYVMKELHLPKDAFSIGQLLREYPIRVERHEELFLIMQSLYSGNIHRLESASREQGDTKYIEAKPETQQLQLYDAKGHPLDVIQKAKDVMKVHPPRQKWQELQHQKRNNRRRR